MIRRSDLLILITIVVNSLPMALLAQSTAGMDINFTDIYNTRYTDIGVPIRDSVYILPHHRQSHLQNGGLSINFPYPRVPLRWMATSEKVFFGRLYLGVLFWNEKYIESYENLLNI